MLYRFTRGLFICFFIDFGFCFGEERFLLRFNGILLVCGGGDVVGFWVVVGLLDVEEVVRFNAFIFEFKGEVKDSFLVFTGEDVLDIVSGGGEENLRYRRGDLLFIKCSFLLFWLVVKNNFNDLKIRVKVINKCN